MLNNVIFSFIGEFTPENFIIWLVLFGGISVLYMIFMPQMMGLQATFAIRGAKKSLEKLEKWSNDSKKIALKELSEHGRSGSEIKPEFENFLEFFTISPVADDPRGVLQRLEHLLDVRKKRFEENVRRMAPEADEETAANLEMTIEGALANYTLYKIVRHYISVAEKTNSMQLATMLQMMLPMLEKMAEAYHVATQAFSEEKVIGDGIGPMIATNLISEAPATEEIKDTVYAKTEIEGRTAYIVKAKGPGGRVGKPGELIKNISRNRKLDRIIMVDAGLKLEGEESGKIVEGVGAAIGGPPVEKHKIEEVSTKREIPVDAIVIKQSLKEAITPMTDKLAGSVDGVVEKIKKAIRERTDEGDVIIVAGIGNTIGVGQSLKDLPTEFPKEEKEEDELESFVPIPGMAGSSKFNKFKDHFGVSEKH